MCGNIITLCTHPVNAVTMWLWKWWCFSTSALHICWAERTDDCRAVGWGEEGTTTGFSASFSQQSWSSRRSVSFHHLYTGRGRQVMANCQLPVNTWIKTLQPLWFFLFFFQCFSSHLQMHEVAGECCKLVFLSMGKSNSQGEQIPAGVVRQRGRTPEAAQPFPWHSCAPLDGKGGFEAPGTEKLGRVL